MEQLTAVKLEDFVGQQVNEQKGVQVPSCPANAVSVRKIQGTYLYRIVFKVADVVSEVEYPFCFAGDTRRLFHR